MKNKKIVLIESIDVDNRVSNVCEYCLDISNEAVVKSFVESKIYKGNSERFPKYPKIQNITKYEVVKAIMEEKEITLLYEDTREGDMTLTIIPAWKIDSYEYTDTKISEEFGWEE